MEATEDDDDLKLVKASAGLLKDLEHGLPKLLWKYPKSNAAQPPTIISAHTQVKKRDLDWIVSLIEPFQGEPQLLDAKLKTLVPQIINAYLQYLQREHKQRTYQHVEFESAVCSLLYVLCKVRGYKVIVGFFNNEPQYLVPIVRALERTNGVQSAPWEVPYVLLLWLSHLLLTPFDLISISTEPVPAEYSKVLQDVPIQLPPLMLRILRLGLKYLPTSTKAQDAAAAMLARFVVRPDVQRYNLAGILVEDQLQKLQLANEATESNVYESLGSFRFFAKVATSSELSPSIPAIYRLCNKLADADNETVISSNAVAKKVTIKIFRNIAILSLRSASSALPLLDFLESTGVLEDVIDYLLRSLADKDTPVRYAAAKAMSLIIIELEPETGHEVIQAVLDTFKEDIPRSGSATDFATANPLKWHGLTLALAHALFSRSASPEQIPDILIALISALQFHQRTATGSSLGTNVRDAANFGIWSLARRYTTAELLAVPSQAVTASSAQEASESVIQLLAVQLLLSACLDPAGNIRRGSSAALQELIGRHPDQVHEGIALVQTVDYQAVGLRRRAMVVVANKAACLRQLYWNALMAGLLGWRGLGSADVPAREAAAESISKLTVSPFAPSDANVLQQVLSLLQQCPVRQVEDLQGLTLTAAYIVQHLQERDAESEDSPPSGSLAGFEKRLWELGETLESALGDFLPRILRSELTASISRYVTAVCNMTNYFWQRGHVDRQTTELRWAMFDKITERILTRHEEWIAGTVPDLVRSQLALKQRTRTALSSLDMENLIEKIAHDSLRSTLHGANRAIALGALVALYNQHGLQSEDAEIAVPIIAKLIDAPNVDWRIIGARALQLVVEDKSLESGLSAAVATQICDATSRGLRDYTIDERGDIGSLVRLQAITCASKILASDAFRAFDQSLQSIKAGVYRLSLEKLDRVRLQAAQCRQQHLDIPTSVQDVASASSWTFFKVAMDPISTESPLWVKHAVLEGCISCCGTGAEPLLQASRSAISSHLEGLDEVLLLEFLDSFGTIFRTQIATPAVNTQPTLEFLAFLLDARLVQRAATFRWRNLLAFVQKSHFKSNDVPKLLAAVHMYTGLAEIKAVREEVLKKLVSMLKTNPYARVRIATAEAVWLITKDDALQKPDWSKPASAHSTVIASLLRTHVM